MCGIVGYVGSQNAVDVLITGLSHLEYRGYDSAGIAVGTASGLEIKKNVGRVANLEAITTSVRGVKPTYGIGHTRWATHGGPSVPNAHPHASQKVTIVHNGIIENYQEIQAFLESKGYVISSETDTEIAAHLLDFHYKSSNDPYVAIQKACATFRGSYAIAAIFEGYEDTLFGFREGSPLIVGLGKDESFIASDVSAIMDHTKHYLLLEPGMIAKVNAQGCEVVAMDSFEVLSLDVQTISWEQSSSELGDYAHFMLKEIHEQPALIDKIFNEAIVKDKVSLEYLGISESFFEMIDTIHIVACGTAMHSGLVGKKWIERFAKKRCIVHVASEFRYDMPILKPYDLVIVVSQSGETADTLASLRLAKGQGIKTLGIVNVEGSSIGREVDALILTQAGIEKSVASTKAYTTQIAMLYLVAKAIANESVPTSALQGLGTQMQHILKDSETIFEVGRRYAPYNNAFFIGRGMDASSAVEGSLKLKEISYIHAESYPAGELKHGTISLIDNQVFTVAVSTQSEVHEKTISNVQEIKARDGMIVLITNQEVEGSNYDDCIVIPEVDDMLAPFLSVLPLQLFSYACSVARGCDVDKPRNLAKSVTVE